MIDNPSIASQRTRILSPHVSAPVSFPAEIVIRPPSALAPLDLGELRRHRHLFATLVKRHVRLQFADLRLGWVWPSVRPLLYVLVFAAFRRLSNADTRVTIPYPLYLYSGLVLWYYLLEAVLGASGALRRDASLLTKVYYPRLFTPAVPVAGGLAALGLAALPLVPMMAFYGVAPSVRLLLLPVVVLQVAALAFGVGSLAAAMTITTRDWERFLGNALYLGLFVSPVVYSADMIPAAARWAWSLNPTVGSLLAFRSALFAPAAFPWAEFAYSCAVTLVVAWVGTRTFRAAETEMADRL